MNELFFFLNSKNTNHLVFTAPRINLIFEKDVYYEKAISCLWQMPGDISFCNPAKLVYA